MRFSARLCSFLASLVAASAVGEELEADLLVVGGTESGCAAAVQAARMGVSRVVLVNDIDWLGGQFSAEGLGAIDENRGHGYDGTVPIPRSGAFREIIDAIEEKNSELYGGIRRPGNTRVITTSRPEVSEQVFREFLEPYEKSGQLRRFSGYRVDSVELDSGRVTGVRFVDAEGTSQLTVRARLTIDASDWGDVIQESGAAWEAGVDLEGKYNEPSAPVEVEAPNDLNPITWCLILEEQENEVLFAEPEGYDPRYFNGKWGWIDEEFAYTTRRLVDGNGYEEIDHPDILLINTPPIDYPLDVYPEHVEKALEKTEEGASKKNLVAMSPRQREIVFEDAKRHSLKFYHHLQRHFPKFRVMALSDEFGTRDRLPPKPYIRESLRLKAMHMLREQEVVGFEARSDYATAMFPDAVFSWQFEMDFHPTKREWTTDQGAAGPWQANFRGARRFGRGGTGRCVFPLRSLVPESVDGLLGAQKNLGYSSIVSSSCRLHDQSMHAGQASGAVAAIALESGQNPRELWSDPEAMARIWSGLLDAEQGAPLAIWPFSDLDPFDPGFEAIQQLALRRILPLGASDTAFQPDEKATAEWKEQIRSELKKRGYPFSDADIPGDTRRAVALHLWDRIAEQTIPPSFFSETFEWQRDPRRDGVSAIEAPFPEDVIAIDFGGRNGGEKGGYLLDKGAAFEEERGMGWKRDLREQIRVRKIDPDAPRDSFVFTRAADTWELALPDGAWEVTACLGDISHDQSDQNLSIEGVNVVENASTQAGRFLEVKQIVDVTDGRLTLGLGVASGGSNTCLNWIVVRPVTGD